MLYLVPTPIGNLKDITIRAEEVLKSCDLILAEDTRVTGKLLKHLGIDTPMRSYHSHNEHKITERIVEELSMGYDYALVTDAGTPAISDPGYLLVKSCHEAGVTVTCLPGASSVIPALACSGLPSDRFYFEGFLPSKKGRKKRLEFLTTLNTTIVLFESPHRIIKTLRDISVYFGNQRQIACIKEISKMHETILRGAAVEVLETVKEKSIKGEFVVVISKNKEDPDVSGNDSH